MLIVMKSDATREQVDAVKAYVKELGFTPNEIPGPTRVAIGITGNEGPLDPGLFANLAGVVEAVPVSRPWELGSREGKPDDTVVSLPSPGGKAQFGGGRF